jgi:LmbE family N-acetylglucosaminyl deacetylase
MKKISLILIALFLFGGILSAQSVKQLHILIIGAHPDDAEESCGTAALWIAAGHKVKLVSVTNGDAGHQTLGGGELARRRAAEAKKAGEVIGAEYLLLDNHDGELQVTLENRHKIIRLIREWQADIVITHRPNDYHPDHRNTAQLVLDAAYMVTVPNVCPETPICKKNPYFLYTSDDFTKPVPFKADVVVGIDQTLEKKIDMYDCHVSQVYEWLPFNSGRLDQVPAGKAERREWLAKRYRRGAANMADEYRSKLIELYGQEKGSKIKAAEAFEDSEYGSRLTKENIPVLFPFLGK